MQTQKQGSRIRQRREETMVNAIQLYRLTEWGILASVVAIRYISLQNNHKVRASTHNGYNVNRQS